MVFELIDHPKSHNLIIPYENINKLNYVMKDNILRLEISMNDLFLMHIIKRPESLLHDILGQGLGQFSLFSQKIIELARITQLQYKINVLAITKESVEFHDVGIVEE